MAYFASALTYAHVRGADVHITHETVFHPSILRCQKINPNTNLN